MLETKREALSSSYACFKEVSYVVTMLRRNKNSLPKNMLIIKKVRLEQGSAELVEFGLTHARKEICVL